MTHRYMPTSTALPRSMWSTHAGKSRLIDDGPKKNCEITALPAPAPAPLPPLSGGTMHTVGPPPSPKPLFL
jgi:hypothetical protein